MNLPSGIRRFTGFTLRMLVVFLCIFSSQLAFAQTTDLALQHPGLSATSIVAGDTATASALMANVGTTAIPQYSAAGFYLSANATLEASDVLLGTDTLFTSLAAGSTQPVSANLVIPAGTQAGSYYILFAADYGHAFAESNEANNLGAVAITVTAPSVDLYLRLSSSFISIGAGAKVSYNANIVCAGRGIASSVYIGTYFSKDATVDDSDILIGTAGSGEALTAGTNKDIAGNFTVPVNTAPGSYWVLHKVDHAGLVAEFDEMNNVSRIAVTVTSPTYDFSFLSTQRVTPNVVAAGTAVTAAATVINWGTSPANVGLHYYLSADNKLDTLGSAADVLLGDYKSASALDGGNAPLNTSQTLTIPDTTAAGHYYIILQLDPKQAVPETNETNNLHPIAISIGTDPLPDLAFYYNSPTVQTTTLPAAGNAICNVNIQNIGTGSSLGLTVGYFLSTDSTFDASDRLLNNFNGRGLPPGITTGISGHLLGIPAETAAGNYYLLFVIDYHNIIAEIDETNNVRGVAIAITEPMPPVQMPDLFISKSTVSSSLTAAGDTVVANFTLSNLGTATAGACSVSYYFSSSSYFDPKSATFLGQLPVDTLASGQERAYPNVNLMVPNGTVPGNYFLFLVADETNNITEGSESNNIRSVVIKVTGPGSDLVIIAMSSESASPAGGTRDITVPVANQGTTPTASSKINVYLSENFTIESADALLASSTVEGLAGNQTMVKQIPITIPTGTPPGDYKILVVIDPDNTVKENQENNNIAFSSYTVGEIDFEIAAGSPAFLLNMTTNAPVPPGPVTLEAGHRVETSIRISNSGAANSSFTTLVRGYFSTDSIFDAGDPSLYVLPIGSLPPQVGANFQYPIVTIPPDTRSGSYYLLFVVDPSNATVENNDTNNLLALPITVKGPPQADLVLQSPTVSPAKATAGDTLRLATTLANTGTAPAPASTLRYFLSADTALDSADVALASAAAAALAGDTTLAVSTRLALPANTAVGSYFILLLADADSTVTEENERNNLASIAFQVGVTGKDLTVVSHMPTPDTLVAGSAMPVWVKIFNQGIEAAASSRAGIYLSTDQTLDDQDILIGAGTGGPLAAVTDTTRYFGFTIPLQTAGGKYYLIYKVDRANEEAESDEDNNVRAVALTVSPAPLPDLIVAAAAAEAASALPGTSVTVNATVKNQGTMPVSAGSISCFLSANTTLEDTDVPLGASAATAVAAGAEARLSLTLTLPAETAPGDYYLLVAADQARSITESNETNNLYVFAFSVAAPAPDLTLQNPALSTATVARGSVLTATATLANTGTAQALASKVQYFLSVNDSLESGDVILGESQVAALEAGSTSALSASLSIPATTATGDYFVLLVADATGLIGESHEANNVASVALAVSVASGIEDLQASDVIQVGPNPAPEEVFVSADKMPAALKFTELALFDMNGSKVLAVQAPIAGRALRTRLDVRHLRQGTYLLHIRIGDEVVIRKIVITR